MRNGFFPQPTALSGVPIFLIGFMGAGKTSLGPALARRMGRYFTDMDSALERETGVRVKDFFNTRGEEAFRRAENRTLLKLIKNYPDRVIACGGGTPCFFDNLQQMNNAGLTIYLKVSENELYRRLTNENGSRPVLKQANNQLEQHISQLLAQRTPFYEQAQMVVADDSLSVDRLLNEIEFYYTEYLPVA